jgi:uncharacterized OB-fold protein
MTPKRIDDRLASRPVFAVHGEDFKLLGSRCESCGAAAFPRRVVCIRCGGAQTALELSGAGTIHSWTHLENPPDGFDKAVFYGCVDLVEGPRVLGLLGDEQPRIGDAVQAVHAPARHGAEGFRFEIDHA